MEHPLTWASPRPLWRGAVRLPAGPSLAPSILRFASDDFMEQLLGLLATDPSQLGSHIARHETWRTPDAELATADLVERVPLASPLKKARLAKGIAKPSTVSPSKPDAPLLKLYQPAHQRFYIAAATLACATPGLPDRALRGSHEKTGFVLRRLLPHGPNNALVEYAYLKEAAGNRWQRVSEADSDVLAPGEDINPVFPLTHLDSRAVKRTMWGGLIPVARREEYLAASVSKTAVKLTVGQHAALAPKTAPATPSANSVMARMTEFKMDVAEPWKALIRSAKKAAGEIMRDSVGGGSDAEKRVTRQTQVREQNLQYQMQSWLILADMREWLKTHVPLVLEKIDAPNPPSVVLPANSGVSRLYDWLTTPLGTPVPASSPVDPNVVAELRSGFGAAQLVGGAVSPTANATPYHSTLAAALKALSANLVAALEDNETQYRAGGDEETWPGFHCLLAGIRSNGTGQTISASGFHTLITANLGQTATAGQPDYPTSEELVIENPSAGFGDNDSDIMKMDKVTALFVRALPPSNEAEARPLPFAQKLSQTMRDNPGDKGLFLIRFVHLNEDCGPLHPPTLSTPTEQFHLASFFDSDAPARPIRITLPTDTTPAGLRKHARGTAFVMSNLLCGQVQRAKGLGFVDLVLQVLPWPFHKKIDLGDSGDTGGCKDSGGIDIGMICSLSIPIITICALILLMTIVLLLDFIFRWIPWFIMCFPLPKFNGKGKQT